MTHKHESDVIDAVDFMRPSYGTEKHKAVQKEVDEVYRKAEAFDEIMEVYHSAKFSFNAPSSDGITKVLTVLNRRVFEFKEAD